MEKTQVGDNENGTDGSNDNVYETTNFHKHLERQSKIIRAIINDDKIDIHDVSKLGDLLERWIFTPETRPKNAPGENYVDNDPKLNFYPPFLNPECIAAHYPFFTTMPIPLSCKANCIGTEEYENLKNSYGLPESFPIDFDHWDDGIGSADIISDLKDNQKFALLKSDNGRLRWFKAKAEGMQYWCYPIISIPPSIGKLVMETLISCAENADQNVLPNAKKVAVQVASVGVTNSILKSMFTTDWFIKNCHESLHYCFCHGFVKLIKMLTEVDLSNYVTYHGLTHKNRLNNCGLHRSIEDEDDKRDYIVDTIYLFLVLTWQTAMDIWQQAIDEHYVDSVRKAIVSEASSFVCEGNYEETCRVVSEIVTGGDVFVKAMANSLPDFVNQMQLTNFRTFIAAKSGVPQSICPILPSDCVPISYHRAPPVLWSHIFMLKMASFICNQGDYMKDIPEDPVVTTCLCDCNLCSPHKMPCYNNHLHDEIIALDKLSLSDGSKTATVGVQDFCNCLIRMNVEDFYHDSVTFYKDNVDKFSPHQPMLIKNKKLLAILKELKAKKEAELLKRGQGIYLNPSTGEQITRPLTADDNGLEWKHGTSGRCDRRHEMLPPAKERTTKQNGRQCL